MAGDDFHFTGDAAENRRRYPEVAGLIDRVRELWPGAEIKSVRKITPDDEAWLARKLREKLEEQAGPRRKRRR